ncbi:aromatase/cyclase [Streptomyces sp. A30]|uniref:aromatase/cyclase n=1 Tax=Streptomyces sp. A30 TaxID=2789273 RepID=UPI00397EB145
MPSEQREVVHEIKVSAPAETVYRIVADVADWPRVFPPTVHVEHVERGEREERIRIWATAGSEVKSWTSRRTLDPGGLRVDFRQEVSTPPVAAMSGTWLIEPLSSGGSLVRLLHSYRAVDAAGLTWIDEAVDRNSRSELDALKAHAELDPAGADLVCSFEDTVQVAGSARDLYDFVDQAHLWPERLPHVDLVRFTEQTPGLQVLEMDTRSKDGSTHTTKSYRVTFPDRKIVYKQVTLPALMTLHTGRWTFRPTADGVAASSQHTFVVHTANITKVLGPGTTVPDAVQYVRTALSTNSLATLNAAKVHAETRSRG